MRPIYIQIMKPSRKQYVQHVYSRLPMGSVRDLVGNLRPPSTGIIDLSSHIAYDDEINPLIKYLVRHGISADDIEIRRSGEDLDRINIDNYFGKSIGDLMINLGPDVAERDFQLSRYFVQTSAFRNVSNGQKHIVVGPKGSGKSAILQSLSNLTRHSYITITPEHYSTDILATIKSDNLVNELNAYITTW